MQGFGNQPIRAWVWTLQASENSGDHMTGARIGLGNGVNTANVFYRQFGYAIGGNTAPGN